MSVPGPPQIEIRPRAGDGYLDFYWGPPLADGGSSILNYHIACPGVYTDYTSPTASYYRVTGLTNGTPYTFTLTAVNSTGEGPPATFRTVEPGLIPSIPLDVTATPVGSSAATVSWNAPSSDGGADIKWYVIRARPDSPSAPVISKSYRGTSRQAYIQGFSNQYAYTISVQAVNDPGYSPAATAGPISFGTGIRVLLRSKNFSPGKFPPYVWNDESGHGNNATLETGAASINVSNHHMVSFDGSTSYLLPALGSFPNWTLNVWARAYTQSSYDECIVTDIYSSGHTINFSIVHALDLVPEYSDYACGYFDGSAWHVGTNFATPNGIFNLQVTYDGTAIKTYLNATLLGSVSSSTASSSGNLGIRIGGGWDAVNSRFWIGELGELRIYNRALSQEEVTAAFNESLPDFQDPPA